tara:strand:+ start:677 stop:988 length:312 start_codon:yes stop_codon:yes gene_type:complete
MDGADPGREVTAGPEGLRIGDRADQGAGQQRAHVRDLHHPDIVAQGDELVRKVVRRSAGLNPDQAGCRLLEELQKLRSRQLLPYDHAALSIDAVHLEHRLPDV